MIFGKKKKDLPAEVTPAYMPKIMELLQGAKYDAAMEELSKAAQDYFQRVSKATETIHGHDAAIMIKLFRHMANELERADPQAAKIVAAMKKINLPPIEYRRTK
jgi:hypothetical protein